MLVCHKCGRSIGRIADHVCRGKVGRHAIGAVNEPRSYRPRHCACDQCWDAHLSAVVWDDVEHTDHIVETVAHR